MDGPVYWVWAMFDAEQRWRAEGTYEEHMREREQAQCPPGVRIVPKPVPLATSKKR